MIRRNCKNCGRFTWSQPSVIKVGKGKYCSKKCFDDYRRDYVSLYCHNCGGLYKTPRYRAERHNNNFCSKRCAGMYNGDNKKNGVYIFCPTCGDKFYAQKSRIKRGKDKFCSKKCYNKSITLYPNTAHLRKRVYWKNRSEKEREELHDNYCKDQISNQTNLSYKDIPQELIELKRLNIKRKRIIRNQKQK